MKHLYHKIGLCALYVVLFSVKLSAQCHLQPLSLKERVQSADFVFEGKVISKYSFYDTNQSHIYTAHEIVVFKDFKGNLTYKTIQFVTKGGIIDGAVEVVNPNLTIDLGETGVFFATAPYAMDPNNMMQNKAVLSPYAEAQGMVKYDEPTNTAYDNFNEYGGVESGLYKAIKKYTATNFIVISVKEEIPAPKGLPTILSFTPTTVEAGNNKFITITGDDFGPYTGLATVQFRNPDYYGLTVAYQNVASSKIVQWSNTSIVVYIPGKDLALGKAGAGTGKFRVVNSIGAYGESEEDLNILYNKTNINNREIDLVNDNGSGGYTLAYSTNFTNTNAKLAFENALNNYHCHIGLNMFVSNTTSSKKCPAKDAVNIIAYDNATCPLSGGLLAQSTQWYIACANGDAYFEEMDLIFSSTAQWHYLQSPPNIDKKDFESIAVHEIGHCIGMGHVLDYGKLMYPSLTDGAYIRHLDTDAITCGLAIKAHSTENNSCNGSTAMQPTTACDVRVKIKMFLEGPYNGAGQMNTNLVSAMPKSQPFNTTPWNYAGNETTTTIPANIVDWVLVEIRNDATIVERRAAWLRKDGIVVELDQSEGVKLALTAANYSIIVRSRNHLAVMSKNQVSLPNNTPFDFTWALNVKGTAQVKAVSGGYYALHAGDINADGVITVADFNLYSTETSKINVYSPADLDMNKNVTVADFNLYKANSSKIGIPEIKY